MASRHTLSLLCLLAFPVWAQDDVPECDPAFGLCVEVTAEPLPTFDAASSVQRRDPTGSVTVIDAAVRRGEAKSTQELVAEAPGVVVQQAGGAGQRSSVALRGQASNAALVLLDGVPLGGPGNAVDLSRVPAALLASVEVLRGSGGGRYGPGALGGVVNLVSRSGEGARLFADVSQGSFLTTRASAGASFSLLGGEALLLLHGLKSDGDFVFQYDDRPALPGNPLVSRQRLNNQAMQGGGLVRYRAEAGPWRLAATAEGLTETRGLAGNVFNPTVDANQQSTRGTASVRAVRRLVEGELSLSAWARADGSTLSGSPFGRAPLRQLESGAGVEGVYTVMLPGRHQLTALLTGGADALTEPTGTNPAWARAGAMVQDTWRLFDDAVALDASARVDVAGPFVVFSPKVGAAWVLPQGLRLTANAGQLARAPSFAERFVVQGTLLPNAALRPERALTADVGVQWRTSKSTVSVTGFASLVEDLISYEWYPPTLARPYNFSAAQVSGLEVEGAYRPHPLLEASASYTFLTSANLRDDPRYYGKALPYRPAHRLHARVQGGPRWLNGHVSVLAQSEQFQNRTQALVLPGRAFVDAGLASTFSQAPHLTLGVVLKNLLDAQSQDVDGYPLPPRSLFLTLAVAWDAART